MAAANERLQTRLEAPADQVLGIARPTSVYRKQIYGK